MINVLSLFCTHEERGKDEEEKRAKKKSIIIRE
jgi:hypothetical protein